MRTPSINTGSRRHDGELEFYSFLDALRQRFDPRSAGGGDPDELVDWFVLDWDEPESAAPAAKVPVEPADDVAPPAAATTAAEVPLDLPIHLAAPLHSWRRTASELAVGFGVLIALELLLTGGIGNQGVYPHPYWLVILPIAAARGLVSGLTAAAVGAVLFFGGILQQLGPATWLDVLDYHHGLTPLGFFLAAFVVGHLRDLAAARHAELWRHTIHHATDRAHAAAKVQRLQRSNRDLKIRLLDHSAQFGHLLEAAKRLESATRKDLLEVALDMVVEHCGGERCSVVDTRGDELRVVALRGWSADDLAELTLMLARSPRVANARRTAARFNAFTLEDGASDDGPILIAPLCAEDGTVEALLCLDAVTPECFSHSTASVFFGIGEWAQIGMQRLAAGRDPGDLTPTGQALLRSYTWVGNAADLPARLRVEDGRVEQTGLSTCLIPIHAVVEGTRQADQHKLDQLLESTVLNGLLRGSDSLYRLPDPGSWVVVLPATSASAARVVRSRLEPLLKLLQFGKVRGFRTDVVAPDPRRGALAELAQALSAWVTNPELGAVPRSSVVGTKSPYTILDAMEFARRVQVEGNLSQRFQSELYVVELDFETAPADRPEAVAPLLATFAERFLPQTATVHSIDGDRFAIVMPHSTCSSAFRAGHELARSMATRLGLPTDHSVRFGVFALAGDDGEADTLLFDLFRIKGRRIRDSALADGPAEPAEAVL